MPMPLMLAAAALVGSGPVPQAPSIPVAPRSVSATAGRGKAVLFALDERGERIAETPAPGPARAKRRQEFVYKETTRPLRWAVVVGTVDFRAIRAAVPVPRGPTSARSGPPVASTWSARPAATTEAGRNGPRSTPERTSRSSTMCLRSSSECVRPETRPEAFVDPLPLLKTGEWRGVDVEAFVDPRRQTRVSGAFAPATGSSSRSARRPRSSRPTRS